MLDEVPESYRHSFHRVSTFLVYLLESSIEYSQDECQVLQLGHYQSCLVLLHCQSDVSITSIAHPLDRVGFTFDFGLITLVAAPRAPIAEASG